MKKWFVLLCCFCFFLSATTIPGNAKAAASAQKNGAVKIYINGWLPPKDHPPITFRNRIYVPLNDFYLLSPDVSLDWNEKTKTATIQNKTTKSTYKLVANKSTAYLNGTPFKLEAYAQIINKQAYLPLRFVAYAVGAQIDRGKGADANTLYFRTQAHRKAIQAIRSGDLLSARKAALDLPVNNAYPNLLAGKEGRLIRYLFPEGEARAYYIDQRGVLTYIEVNAEGIANVVWEGESGVGPGGYVKQFGQFRAEEAAQVYFNTIWDSVTYGTVDETGKETELGNFEAKGTPDGQGSISYTSGDLVTAIPNETRTDAIEINTDGTVFADASQYAKGSMEKQLIGSINQYVKAYNKRDPKLLSTLFTPGTDPFWQKIDGKLVLSGVDRVTFDYRTATETVAYVRIGTQANAEHKSYPYREFVFQLDENGQWKLVELD